MSAYRNRVWVHTAPTDVLPEVQVIIISNLLLLIYYINTMYEKCLQFSPFYYFLAVGVADKQKAGCDGLQHKQILFYFFHLIYNINGGVEEQSKYKRPILNLLVGGLKFRTADNFEYVGSKRQRQE